MVVERYRFVRDAMRVAIARAPDLDLVADAGDVVEAIGLAMDHEPDVIVLDVDWPSLQRRRSSSVSSSANLGHRVRNRHPEGTSTGLGTSPANTIRFRTRSL